MLNIRPGHNQRLMEASRTLREYAEFVERGEKVRQNHSSKRSCGEGSDRVHRRRDPQRFSGEEQVGGDQGVSV